MENIMEMGNDHIDSWSLFAVIQESDRKAKLQSPPPPPPPPPPSTAITTTNTDGGDFSGDVIDHDNIFNELKDFYNSIVPQSSCAGSSSTTGSGGTTSAATSAALAAVNQPEFQQPPSPPPPPADQPPQLAADQPMLVIGDQNWRLPQPFCAAGHQQPTPRKMRRHDDRRVYRVNINELANDKWGWRKYGQKPIKGTPYPRNYYRCSSKKGCSARKQVEQTLDDPENFYMVTYTGAHNHPHPPPRHPIGLRPKFIFPREATAGSSTYIYPPPPPPSSDPYSVQIGSSSGFGFGYNPVGIGENNNGGGGDNHGMFIPNAMVDTELWMDMEQLTNMGMGLGSGNGNETGHGFGPDPNVNFGPGGNGMAAVNDQSANIGGGQNIWGCWENDITVPKYFPFY